MSRKYDNAGFRLNEKQYILTVIAVENVNEIYWPMSDSILSLRDAEKKKCHKVNKKHYLENKVESHVKVTVHQMVAQMFSPVQKNETAISNKKFFVFAPKYIVTKNFIYNELQGL